MGGRTRTSGNNIVWTAEKRAIHAEAMRNRPEIGKTCGTCGVEFRTRSYRSTRCPSCQVAHRKFGYQFVSTAKRLGISLSDVEKLYNSGDGSCDACGSVNTGSRRNRRLCIDHDHRTGEIRGLLCASCNLVLGKVDDSVNTLHLLALYLQRHQSSQMYPTQQPAA